jgi:hypothetical protein
VTASPGLALVPTRRLGALPLISHFAARTGLGALLDAWVPTDDPRLAPDPAVVLPVIVANLRTEHRPLAGERDPPHGRFADAVT